LTVEIARHFGEKSSPKNMGNQQRQKLYQPSGCAWGISFADKTEDSDAPVEELSRWLNLRQETENEKI
jgi:hypothetical protein